MNTSSLTVEQNRFWEQIDGIFKDFEDIRFQRNDRNIVEMHQADTSSNFSVEPVRLVHVNDENYAWCNYGAMRSGFIYSDIFNIELDSKIITEIPAQLTELATEIEKSKYILELENNWNQEGASPPKKETWIRAIRFLTKIARLSLNKYGFILDTPVVSPVANGNIDLFWEKEGKYQMLVNIPADKKSLAEYYGDDYGKEDSKGKFDLEKKGWGVLAFFINQNE